MAFIWRKQQSLPPWASLLLIFAFMIPGPARVEAQAEPLVLTLERAIALGFENDEALLQAGQAIAGARAEVMQAKSNALPQLTLSGHYGRNFLKPSFFLPEEFREDPDAPTKVEMGEDNDFVGTAAITQILWAAGRVSAGLVAAREFLEAFRFQEIAVADYVRFNVQEAYFGVLLAAEILQIAEKAFQETEEAFRVARAGFDQGTASRFDVMRAEVELANRKAPLVKATNDLGQAMIVLRRRCGIDPGTEISLADSLEAVLHPADVETLMAAMREGSAEVRALEHQIEVRRQFLRISKAERYPILQFSAVYGIQTQWSEGIMPEKDRIAYNAGVTLGLQIPIFDGLNAKGKINKSRADLRAAELELEKVTRDKELAVRRSCLNLENALTALEGRREAVRLAEEAYRLALVRMQNGLATPLERLD
ncbi:MAG: TolC family protein, partial [Candidatus Krumholzibacteria bacterium]|nr:TolC family protein [Candidatus Krumholzibacteria bacterium]